MSRINAFFVLPNVHGGGAQRVTLNIIRHLDRAKYRPSLIILTELGEYTHLIPHDARLFHLKCSNAHRALWRLAKLIKNEEPDILYSALNYVNCVVLAAKSLSRSRAATIVSEHSYLSGKIESESYNELVANAMRWLYPRADKVICVSQAMADDLRHVLNLPPSQLEVIYNPIVDDQLLRQAEEPVSEIPWFIGQQNYSIILAVGNLVPEKGHDHLIKAFKIIRDIIDARLIIIGEGKKRNELEQLTKDLGIQEEIRLPGFLNNPYKFMARADVFVLSSVIEGLPTVLVEAMACGIPVVASDCPSGPSEVIIHGENGLLVPPADPETLAKAILRILQDKKLASRLAQNGKVRANDFRIQKIVKEYESLMQRLVAQVG